MTTMRNETNDNRPQRTYNFNAPIGQFIDHVDTINFRMDGNGEFHFGKVDNIQTKRKELSSEQLARAIERCQKYFWGNSAYAVVFCLCRDEYDSKMTKMGFEKMVEALPYQNARDYNCPLGTIANAFSDNPIFREKADSWDDFKPLPRIIKLRDELRKELKL